MAEAKRIAEQNSEIEINRSDNGSKEKDTHTEGNTILESSDYDHQHY